MKSKWDKLKELSKNKYTKPIVFFGFYFIFFSVILIIASLSNNQKQEVEEKTMWDMIGDNYEYLYNIDSNNDLVISLDGKRYNNKELFNIKVNGVKKEEVYKFYDDIFVKVDNASNQNESFIHISENELFKNDYINIDNMNVNYMNIDYIKDIVADAELMDSKTNFDGSRSDIYVFGNINIEVIDSSDNVLKILITDPLYKLVMQYKNINNVKDFVVEK